MPFQISEVAVIVTDTEHEITTVSRLVCWHHHFWRIVILQTCLQNLQV